MVARLRDPPATLPADPPSWDWSEWRPMVRVYHKHKGRAAMAPRTWGPIGRFDPHVRDRRKQPRDDPTGRGVLYVAIDLATALAEAYPDQWPRVDVCPHARAAWVQPRTPIALLDLTGPGAMAIGAVGTLAWGDEPRLRTQRWGRRIYEHYNRLGGIRYRAANQGGESVALWERAPGLDVAPGGDRKLWAVWKRVVVALAEQRRFPRRVAAADCKRCHEAGYVT